MSKRKRLDVTEAATSKPFFARYLEGQGREESSAIVEGRKNIAHKRAIKPPPLQTLKFPSDGDELHYCPYYTSKADVPKQPGGGLMTLKFPSDRDEDIYYAEYTSIAAAPKGKFKAKGGTVNLKKKKQKK
jgi:hypothetical protein